MTWSPGYSNIVVCANLSLFKPDCLELVLTIINTSDSKFKWITDNGHKNIIPNENTLAIVMPGTVEHSVTSVNKGYRTILKFIVQKEKSVPNYDFKYEIESCPI